MTKDQFEDMMNDCEVPVRIMGIEFLGGSALRKLDPVAFDEVYWTFYHTMEEEDRAEVECTE